MSRQTRAPRGRRGATARRARQRHPCRDVECLGIARQEQRLGIVQCFEDADCIGGDAYFAEILAHRCQGSAGHGIEECLDASLGVEVVVERLKGGLVRPRASFDAVRRGDRGGDVSPVLLR